MSPSGSRSVIPRPEQRTEVSVFGIVLGALMEARGIPAEIAESWANYDAMGMMQQLGAIPSPEQQQAQA